VSRKRGCGECGRRRKRTMREGGKASPTGRKVGQRRRKRRKEEEHSAPQRGSYSSSSSIVTKSSSSHSTSPTKPHSSLTHQCPRRPASAAPSPLRRSFSHSTQGSLRRPRTANPPATPSPSPVPAAVSPIRALQDALCALERLGAPMGLFSSRRRRARLLRGSRDEVERLESGKKEVNAEKGAA
jgi:hypothetical protein